MSYRRVWLFTLLALAGTVLSWNQAQVSARLPGIGKTGDVVESGDEADSGNGADSRHRGEPSNHRIFADQVHELLVRLFDLFIETMQ